MQKTIEPHVQQTIIIHMWLLLFLIPAYSILQLYNNVYVQLLSTIAIYVSLIDQI